MAPSTGKNKIKELPTQNLKEIREKQKNIGEDLYKALLLAAQENTHNEIRVEVDPANNGVYSIFVSSPNKNCSTLGGLKYPSYPILQVDVPEAKSNICIFIAPYGPDRTYNSTSIRELTKDLSEYVQNYQLSH